MFNLVVAARGHKLKGEYFRFETLLVDARREAIPDSSGACAHSEPVDERWNPNHGAGPKVLDKTELTGFYDFEIEWAPNNTGGDASGPSVFAAVQDALGLKLEPGIAPRSTPCSSITP